MPSVERSLTINAPPERVYEAFMDLSRWLEWNPHLREVRPLSEGPLALGLKTRVALKLSPFASTWEVTEIKPGRSFAWTSSSFPGVRLIFDHIAESANGGTQATLRIDVEGPLAFVAMLTGAVYGRILERSSLGALKRMLEGEAAPAPEPAPPPPEEPAAAAEPELEGGAEAEGEPKNE